MCRKLFAAPRIKTTRLVREYEPTNRPFLAQFAALPATANTIDYTFTKIADSTQGFTNFFGYDVNDSGIVAFNSNGNVFVTNGVAVTPTGLTSGWWPSINNAGTVAFLGQCHLSSVVAQSV